LIFLNQITGFPIAIVIEAIWRKGFGAKRNRDYQAMLPILLAISKSDCNQSKYNLKLSRRNLFPTFVSMDTSKFPSFFEEEETRSELLQIRNLIEESQIAGKQIPDNLPDNLALNQEDNDKVLHFYLSILKAEVAYAHFLTRIITALPEHQDWIEFYSGYDYPIADVIKAQVFQYFGADKSIDELMPLVLRQNEMTNIAMRSIEKAQSPKQP
jgi:hypothetical protein